MRYEVDSSYRKPIGRLGLAHMEGRGKGEAHAVSSEVDVLEEQASLRARKRAQIGAALEENPACGGGLLPPHRRRARHEHAPPRYVQSTHAMSASAPRAVWAPSDAIEAAAPRTRRPPARLACRRRPGMIASCVKKKKCLPQLKEEGKPK